MKTTHLLTLASLFCAAGIALAQQETEESGRTVRFYSLTDHMPRYYYDMGKNEQIEIGSATGSLSLPHPMPSDRILEIYRQVLPPPEAPVGTEPLKQILATAQIPAGFSKAIVFLSSEGDADTGSLKVAVFGDSYRLHPKATIRVFNLSPTEIRLKVGAEASHFKSGQEGVMPWAGGRDNVVVFQTWANKDNDWRTVGINELATRPNLRGFMVVAKGTPVVTSNVFFDAVPDEE